MENFLIGVVFRLYFGFGVVISVWCCLEADKWEALFDVAKHYLGDNSKLPLGRQLEGSSIWI